LEITSRSISEAEAPPQAQLTSNVERVVDGYSLTVKSGMMAAPIAISATMISITEKEDKRRAFSIPYFFLYML
jgi:hypothetical protein